MSMYCYQCQEAVKNSACTVTGACGKNEEVAKLQDVFIHILKGISVWTNKARKLNVKDEEVDLFIIKGLFATITNVNFDSERFVEYIHQGFKLREKIKISFMKAYKDKFSKDFSELLHDSTVWYGDGKADFLKKADSIGVLSETNEDIRSLKELLIYGLKGIAAYADHAYVLRYKSEEIFAFIEEALAETTRNDISVKELISLVLKSGELAVKTMELLDKANTTRYGNPEITEVYTGLIDGPAILVSGHDLFDFEEILKQTEGKGIYIYTHGEMLPANAYPEFKKYKHLVGNFGTSWFNQTKEFEEFNGAILFTTNCIVPPRESYKNRLFTTGLVGWPGVQHISESSNNKAKDFTPVIKKALELGGVTPKIGKKIVIGFAHNQTMALADKIIDAVKSGAIKQFIVMAGCDGRQKNREYYTDVAKILPDNSVILTAGCAKYRYNMLNLGDIGGIPRVIDAGQCNDSYSLIYIALKLKEAFGLKDINDLPISYDIAWYEQKAVCVLLALLYLGVKNIRIGPTLPAFLSPGVVSILVNNFALKPITTPEQDVVDMLGLQKASS